MDVAAGWYPDPGLQYEYRWWNGTIWTEHVAQGGTRMSAPLPSAQAFEGVVAASPSGTSASTDRRPAGNGREPDVWSVKGQTRLFGLQLSPVLVLVVVAVFVVFAMALASGIGDGANQRAEVDQYFNERYGD